MSKKINVLGLIIFGGSFLFLFSFLVNAQTKQDPVAVIDGPNEVYKCADLSLDGSGSIDPDGGNIVNFEWKKGNQVLGTENTLNINGGLASITNRVADLIITLIVTDDEGDTNSKNKTIDILENKTPVISEVENSDEDGIITEQEEFFLEVKITSGTNDDSLEYWWDREYNNEPIQNFFEISDIDRTTDDYIITKKSKIKFTPKYGIFNGEENKEITVTLKVTAEDKCEQSSEKKQIPITIIRNTLPLAKITCSNDPCRFNEGSSFNLTAGNSFSGSYFDNNDELKGTADPTLSNPDIIEKYQWNWIFTDKTTGETKTGSKTEEDPDLSLKFDDSGDIVLTLKITDSHQNIIPKEPFTDRSSNYTKEQKEDAITDTIEIEILETQDDPPIANASATKTYTKIHQNFTLDGRKSKDDNGIEKYMWKISHPVYYPPGNEVLIETNEETYSYTFGNLGDFTITLTVRDTGSLHQENSNTITVAVGETSCICTNWTNRGCEEGGCASGKMWQTRSCTPSNCRESKCVDDNSCITGGPPQQAECGQRGCESGETTDNCPQDCAQCDYSSRQCPEGKICKNKRCTTTLTPISPWMGSYKALVGGQEVTVNYKGLVPCGKSEAGVDESEYVTKPCQFCHFFVMFDGIVDYFLFYVVFPLAVLLMVIGGIMFITAAENPARVETAKKLMTSTIIGIVIIFSAWLIINLFFSAIGISEFGLQFTGPGQWFTIDCPIKF